MKAILFKLNTLYHGRLNRVRYINYTTITGIAGALFWGFVTLCFIPFMHSHFNTLLGIIYFLVVVTILIATLVPLSIFTIARCHDINKNGWFSLITLIPFAYLFFIFLPSKNQNNRYGVSPKPNPTVAKVFAGIIAALTVMGTVQNIITLIVLLLGLLAIST